MTITTADLPAPHPAQGSWKGNAKPKKKRKSAKGKKKK